MIHKDHHIDYQGSEYLIPGNGFPELLWQRGEDTNFQRLHTISFTSALNTNLHRLSL